MFDSSAQRVDSLPDRLHGHNHHRTHTALAGKLPVSRVTNVPRFDNQQPNDAARWQADPSERRQRVPSTTCLQSTPGR